MRWEDQLFEVLDMKVAEGGGVRYTLALWDERHAIRVAESYDTASETGRQEERNRHAQRERNRWMFVLISPVLGLLPAREQERIETEYAIPATRLTMLSAIPLLLFGCFCFIVLRAVSMGGPLADTSVPAPLPMPVLLFGQYFWPESMLRLAVAIGQGRPIGSLVGHILHALWSPLAPRTSPPPQTPVPVAQRPVAPGPSREKEAADRFRLLEPFLALLGARDQAKLKEHFDFDGVRWGRVTAIVLLVAVGPMFVATCLGTLLVQEPSDLLVLAVTGALVVEQVFRLRKLGRRELAPSVLRFVIRPLARPLLTAASR